MKKDLKKQIMNQVNKGEIKKRSSLFFKFIQALIIATLVLLGLIATYSFNLMFYLPQRARFAPPSPEERFLHTLEIIPWPIMGIGALALGIMIFIYRKYEGGYKVHLKWIIIIASIITLASGYVVFASNLNERLDQRPGIHKFHDYSEEQFVPGGRRLKRLQDGDGEVRGRFHEN